MKKIEIYCFVLLLAMAASCNKEDKSPASLIEETYSGRDNIEVTYNGTLMAGKQAKVTPRDDNRTADILFESYFDVSQLGDAFKGMAPIQSPGVLPGTPKLNLTVPLTVKDGKYSYSYSGETDYVTYSLNGTITDKKLTADFSNVRLKDQRFSNTAWKPLSAAGLPTSDTQPIHIVWENSLPLPIPIPELDYTIQDLLRIIVNAHLIPAYHNTANMSLTQVIANGLKTVAFNPDGNLPVTYLQTSNGASVFTLAPKCTFQYHPISDRMINLYVNPTDLLSLILLNNDKKDPNIPENPWKSATKAETSFPELIGNLSNMVLPLLSQGIPMNCIIEGDQLELFIGSEVLIPLLKNGIVPLLQNPVVEGIVKDYIESNGELASYSSEIMALYEALPLLLEQTTRLELGLNLTAEGK